MQICKWMRTLQDMRLLLGFMSKGETRWLRWRRGHPSKERVAYSLVVAPYPVCKLVSVVPSMDVCLTVLLPPVVIVKRIDK